MQFTKKKHSETVTAGNKFVPFAFTILFRSIEVLIPIQVTDFYHEWHLAHARNVLFKSVYGMLRPPVGLTHLSEGTTVAQYSVHIRHIFLFIPVFGFWI
jgi:hypothetical protein